MIRIPDPGRFELRLMDGSVNPYLLQAGVIAAGINGINKKLDPGEPLTCNMYTDYKNYQNLKKNLIASGCPPPPTAVPIPVIIPVNPWANLNNSIFSVS